ncbi:hypothetical protein PhCBS80983_g06221 [Powellomyces hirtus]|uniref:Methyltransferase small domain-containing protein n=1 Tax=Powellomyces hirtus TaxID=109895 RepID=A0A507DQ26_9FUNG|nr:hypothetical protein PhCBS80983_g06221 [Powellomyces hirtus]
MSTFEEQGPTPSTNQRKRAQNTEDDVAEVLDGCQHAAKRRALEDGLSLSEEEEDHEPDTDHSTTFALVEDDEELVLSEVHINTANGPARTNGCALRRTTFSYSDPLMGGTDGDAGDVHIRHEMATPLRSVGLQVWSGALLLADFVLTNRHGIFGSDATVLELGCGAGLVAIVCARLCRRVYATDLADLGVLELCRQNAVDNGVDVNVQVRGIDFRDSTCLSFHANNKHGSTLSEEEHLSCFEWKADDWADIMANCKTVVAADIIYDDSVTFAFVQRLPAVLARNRTLYLALEKRVLFSLDDRDVAAPARDYLFKTLDALNADRTEQDPVLPAISASRIEVKDVPQWFSYQRTKELELWKFTMPD